MRILPVVGLFPLLVLSMAETCGPVGSFLPAYTPGTVVTDDALVGTYVLYEEGAKGGLATIQRDDTSDGPSYLLELTSKDRKKKLLSRLFRVNVQGTPLVDIVLLPTSRVEGVDSAEPLPQHIFARVLNDADGVHLTLLSGSWVEKENVPTVLVPVRYFREKGKTTTDVKSARVLAVADQAALLQVLARAVPVDDAWDMRFDFLKPGAPPPLAFTLTVESGEKSRDMSSQRTTFKVRGDTVTQASEHRGRNAGLPGMQDTSRTWRLTDVTKVRTLVDAARAVKRPAPANNKVPAVDTRYVELCLTLGTREPRCVERLPEDESGADYQALRALSNELFMSSMPSPPASP